MNAGIDVAFAQFLASISLDATSHAGSGSSSAAPTTSGKFCLLSDVTRKIVITPTHAIGCRRETVLHDDVATASSTQQTSSTFPPPAIYPELSASYFASSSASTAETYNSAPARIEKPVVVANGSSSNQGPAASKPSVRIRVASDDKKTKAVPPVRFTLSSQANAASTKATTQLNRTRTTAASAVVVSSETQNLHVDGVAAEDYYQNEFIHDHGGGGVGDDDGEMNVE